MRGAVKRRWLRALRSEKYKQGQGGLRRDNRFCCLGVLCDLSHLAKWVGTDSYEGGREYGREGPVYFPTERVLAWADLLRSQANELARMNDNFESFSAIADYIEREL